MRRAKPSSERLSTVAKTTSRPACSMGTTKARAFLAEAMTRARGFSAVRAASTAKSSPMVDRTCSETSATFSSRSRWVAPGRAPTRAAAVSGKVPAASTMASRA